MEQVYGKIASNLLSDYSQLSSHHHQIIHHQQQQQQNHQQQQQHQVQQQQQLQGQLSHNNYATSLRQYAQQQQLQTNAVSANTVPLNNEFELNYYSNIPKTYSTNQHEMNTTNSIGKPTNQYQPHPNMYNNTGNSNNNTGQHYPLYLNNQPNLQQHQHHHIQPSQQQFNNQAQQLYLNTMPLSQAQGHLSSMTNLIQKPQVYEAVDSSKKGKFRLRICYKAQNVYK